MNRAYRALSMSLLLVTTLLLAACSSPAAAPAAAPAEAAAGSQVEKPAVNPADQAPEATAQPEAATEAATSEVQAAGATQRVFQIVPEESSMQYQVEEEFLGQPVPFVTAIGKTSALNGSMQLSLTDNTVTIDEGRFEADISTLTSDRPRRDNAIRDRWLESAKFPIATFVAKEAANVPADAALGKDVSFQVMGDMTIRDVTNPMTWDMTAKVDGDTLAGTATTFFLMKDYGFDPPDIAGMLKVTDGVSVTVQFVAQEVK